MKRVLRQFSTITNVKGREILDSRGNPTVEAEITTSKGKFMAAVPSGASTGIYEALELRDKDPKRYLGKGVQQAVQTINTTIRDALIGKDVTDQVAIDNLMVQQLDGSVNEWGWSKSKLGANSVLAVSLANARAGACSLDLPLYQHIQQLSFGKITQNQILPVPCLNVINGGKHAGNKLAMQEFMLMPTGASSFKEALQMGAEVYHCLKKVIEAKYGLDATNVGDEGGFAPSIQDNREGLELLMEAIDKSGHAGKIELAMDVAASEFFLEGKYDLDFKNTANKGDQRLSGEQLLGLYADFVKDYPIVSIEDPFDQDDFASYARMTAQMGKSVQVVGDDLLVTNPKRVQAAIDQQACNALLLKVNQIGSLSESIQAARLSQENGLGVMVSHRSGETEDHFIADLVVGLSTGQIKTGAPCRSERLAKYNQLLRIEEQLGSKAIYAGKHFKNPLSLL